MTVPRVRIRRGRTRLIALSGATIWFCVLYPIQLLAEDHPEKNQYNLFRPTPDSLLRDFTTDRPDKTESPFTVDAGHFQVELDLLNYTYDQTGQERVKTLAIAPVNFKVGVLNNVDLQIIAETYNVQKTRDLGVGSSRVDLQACKLEYSIVSPK